MSTSSITFDLTPDKPEKKHKDRNHVVHTRTLRAKRVTVQGDPGEPPSMGVPTSNPGGVVPYIIGRQRIFQPNTLWYGNLAVHTSVESEITSRTVEQVDDGGAPANQPVTTITETEYVSGYDLDIHVALCLGPDVHLIGIYEDNNRIWQGDASGARTIIDAISGDAVHKAIFYDGRFNQNVGGGGEMTINAPGYVGVACVNLLEVNVLEVCPALSFEVTRTPNPLGLSNADNVNADGDVNPMTALADVIINKWGGAGTATNRIDNVSLTAAAVRLAAEGIFCSIINLEGGTSTISVIQEIEQLISGFIFEDPADGLIKCRLVRWDLYDFNNAILLNESNVSELRDFQKQSWVDAATKSVAQFTNREVEYTQDIVMAQSPMVSGSSREIEPATYAYPIAMSVDVASKCLARDMILYNQPSWAGEVQCSRVLADALPGDLVLFSWAEYNIENLPMIVNDRSDIAGDVAIVASISELINVNDTVLFAVPEPSLFNPPEKDPATPLSAKVMSAPYFIQVNAGYDDRIWTKRTQVCTPLYLVEAYNSIQSSFDVRMLNYPDQPSPPVGDQPTINREALYASVGQLPDPITALDGWISGKINSLFINGVIRKNYLKSKGLAGVQAGEIFLIIDDEIMSFEACENQGSGIWELTNVWRGLLDTAPAAHSAGSKVYVINNNWTDRIGMSFDIEPDYIPHLRFCSRTPDDKQVNEGLDYSDWTPDGRVNRPLRPVEIKLNGTRSTSSFPTTAGASITVSWKNRNRKSLKKIPILTDASQGLEDYDNGSSQGHRVYLVDSAASEYDLGTAPASPSGTTSKTVAVPSGVALGAGYIKVVAENTWGQSIQAEHYPILIS